MSDEYGLWVTTEQGMEGKGDYWTVVHFNDDLSLSLSPRRAEEYCRYWLSHITWAEYDAAVMTQMTKLLGEGGQSQATALQLVADLRSSRPDLDKFGEFWIETGVARDVGRKGVVTYRPFLTTYWNKEPMFQQDLKEARLHAMHVIETPLAADADRLLSRTLVHTYDLSPAAASGVINDLSKHRQSYR